MSRAFVKESDGDDGGEALPEKAVSTHRNLVTAEGLDQIEAQIRHWREAATSARGQADRAAMALAARELRYWSARRATSELVPTRPATEVVRFGSRVTLGRADGSTVAFRIVGEDEADPALGKISWVAPLARSVLGRSAGESVVFQEQTAEIRAID